MNLRGALALVSIVALFSTIVLTPVQAQVFKIEPLSAEAGSEIRVLVQGSLLRGSTMTFFISTNDKAGPEPEDILLISGVAVKEGLNGANLVLPHNLSPGIWFIKIFDGFSWLSSPIEVKTPEPPNVLVEVAKPIHPGGTAIFAIGIFRGGERVNPSEVIITVQTPAGNSLIITAPPPRSTGLIIARMSIAEGSGSVGTYVLGVTVTVGFLQATKVITFEVTEAPPIPPLSALVRADSIYGNAPFTVSLSGIISGGTPPYSFLWDFGDGSRSISGNLRHTFANPGNYNVTMVVTDDAGESKSDIALITVVPPATSQTSSASATQSTVLSVLTEENRFLLVLVPILALIVGRVVVKRSGRKKTPPPPPPPNPDDTVVY